MVSRGEKKQIEKLIKSKLDELNWIHTMEVRAIAQNLAKKERADKEIVDIAVLFHDIGKPVSEQKHHVIGARVAKSFLKNLGVEKSFIEKVVSCVRTHGVPWENLKKRAANFKMPKTPEEKVLFDADMIQQLSPFGIAKHLIKYSKYPFRECVARAKKELLTAYSLLLTKSGREMAKPGLKLVKHFFDNLGK